MQAKATGADVIIFDNELSPGQQRKFEELSGLAVIDREEVILDIFNGRARTREARLQVELARMEYSLPRLARAWGHLSRQQGVGGKGEGESQLETDRRLVRKRIDIVKAELRHRALPTRHPAQAARAHPRAAGRHRRVHERGQVQPAQAAHRRGRVRGGQAVRHARPDHPPHRPARRPAAAADGHGRLRAQAAHTGSSKRSNPRWKKRSFPTFLSTCSTPASRRFLPSTARRWMCWRNSARRRSAS